MKHLITGLMIIGFIASSATSVGASPQIYIEEATYSACDLDNKFSSEVIAKERVKKMLLNELVDDAEKIIDDLGLPTNRTNRIAEFSTCVTIEPLKETWEDGNYHYKASIKADVQDIINDFNMLKKSGGKTTDMLANRALANLALKNIEQIKEEISRAGDISNKRVLYHQAVNRLHAADWYERARFYGFSGALQEAIDAYSKVIEYNPDLAIAYYNRGYLNLTYLNDKEKAISDHQMANQLFFNDAIGYYKSKQFDKCIESLDYAISLNQKDASAYYQRGACYIGIGKQDKVLEDFKAAAKFGHTQSQEMLKARGIAW